MDLRGGALLRATSRDQSRQFNTKRLGDGRFEQMVDICVAHVRLSSLERLEAKRSWEKER